MSQQQTSLFVSSGKHKLHIRRIWQQKNRPVVVMFHGVIEDGAIFYKDSDKGLANYLANNGFDVYVVDFRGKGKSHPSIQQDSDHDQYDVINDDIPAVIDFIAEQSKQQINVICHSWGGVLFSSAYVRQRAFKDRIASILCFGTKRRVSVWNMDRLLKVSLFWNNLSLLITKRRGYLDAKRYGLGSAPETRRFIKQSVFWVRNKRWVDPVDGFDYLSEAKKITWPPTWYLTGVNDQSLGHPKDVYNFLQETSTEDAKFSVLSKENGNLVDYDHINILTHKNAQQDHFVEINDWLCSHA